MLCVRTLHIPSDNNNIISSTLYTRIRPIAVPHNCHDSPYATLISVTLYLVGVERTAGGKKLLASILLRGIMRSLNFCFSYRHENFIGPALDNLERADELSSTRSRSNTCCTEFTLTACHLQQPHPVSLQSQVRKSWILEAGRGLWQSGEASISIGRGHAIFLNLAAIYIAMHTS